MVQVVEQTPSVFGRIGKGLGAGLAEQIPKEVERSRLSQGLKNLSENSDNLSPLQAYAQAAGIPGITPSMLQSLPEILKQQGLRKGFQGKGKGQGKENFATPQTKGLDIQFGNENAKKPSTPMSPTEIKENEQFGLPQIEQNNPLRESAIPKGPWTQERRNQDIGNILEDFPQMTIPEAQALSADNERRDLSQPETQQKIDEYLKKVQTEADTEFDSQLKTKLQKTDVEGVYKDITGENIVAIKRGIASDLRTNPNASIKDVVNKWTNRALDLAKTKSQLDKLSKRDIIDDIFKGTQTRKKLETYQKIFKDSNNSEEYFNLLKDKFEMSPQGAGSIAYPPSSGMGKFINGVKPGSFSNPEKLSSNSRKYAKDFENNLTASDSLLSVSRRISEKDPTFDQNAFFDQLRSDEENGDLRLSPRQRRELAEAEGNVLLPTWGDFFTLPWTGGKR